MIASSFISQGHPVRKVLSFVALSPSSYYFIADGKKTGISKGIKASSTTLTHSGDVVCNSAIVEEIKALLEMEFVDYGYLKVCHVLKEKYLINQKKVYRLMKEHKLLYVSKKVRLGSKQWVKELVPKPDTAFSYWEFDIKFMYLHGSGKYVPLLSVIDVKSRWLLGHLCQSSIKKEDVKGFMDVLIDTYKIPDKITVRCDNGSQFESNLVRDYFLEKGIVQEFTKPATPEQNAHIESYHSILERVICRSYIFETASVQLETLNRWALFYNYKRIHSGIQYKSPFKALEQSGTKVNNLFKKLETKNSSIFIALDEKELGSAGVQPNRDSLADRNKKDTPK